MLSPYEYFSTAQDWAHGLVRPLFGRLREGVGNEVHTGQLASGAHRGRPRGVPGPLQSLARSLALLNASFDAANGLDLAIATTADEAHAFKMQGKEHVIRASHPDGPYRRFVLPAVEP